MRYEEIGSQVKVVSVMPNCKGLSLVSVATAIRFVTKSKEDHMVKVMFLFVMPVHQDWKVLRMRPSKSLSGSFPTHLSPIWWGKHCCCYKFIPFSASFFWLSVFWNKNVAAILAIFSNAACDQNPLEGLNNAEWDIHTQVFKSV